jgi:hypothetical protein
VGFCPPTSSGSSVFRHDPRKKVRVVSYPYKLARTFRNPRRLVASLGVIAAISDTIGGSTSVSISLAGKQALLNLMR